VRFVVNTLAPYLLTQKLMPVLAPHARVINLSSAAQAPVSLQALTGHTQLADHFSAYAQSKLALTMWSRQLAQSRGEKGPVIIAVNPGSMLGSKMVRDGFGVAGGDIKIGADILTRLALADEFAHASGLYFDNDARRLSDPHPDALDQQKSAAVVRELDRMLSGL
jgi:NAD(P)-dependent dehydrogenase (short-subunit alcohol dehydrogenase family)